MYSMKLIEEHTYKNIMEDEIMKRSIIKNNLKKYRVYKGYTQLQLSKKLNISLSLLLMIENDHYLPKYQIRVKICDFFNVSLHQMWEVVN